MTNRFGFSWLDFKVGFRMLARYPGITAVGTLAIAVAVALGTLYFEAVNKVRNPRMPMEGGDRMVTVRLWDAREAFQEPRVLHDFAIWREQSRTLENLGAANPFVRNLATEDGTIEPVVGAEVTANAFTLMGAAPLHGRTLSPQDELATEPPVVVLGHTLWKARFAADPGVIGRTVRIGSVTANVVGVMPEGFAFPTSEGLWMPLRVQGATLAPRTGPPVSIFGELAEGASLEAAQAEIAAISERIAAESPTTHQDLRTRVTSYAKPLFEGEASVLNTVMMIVSGVFLALLAIVCMNVATLVFARTATRSWELTVRGALGAGRARIIGQLFVEALVLAGIATVLGVLIAKGVLSYGLTMVRNGGGTLPFWIDDSISLRTMLYAAGLAIFGAAIIGVLPALRATRVNVQDALRSGSAARNGMRFGGFWTGVIVVQVAITVALMPIAGEGVFQANRFMQRAQGIGAERFLSAGIAFDREDYSMDSLAFAARARTAMEQFQQRLAAEPGVEGVAFADRLPVEDQFKYGIEVDTTMGAPADGLRTSTLVNIAGEFFRTFGTSVVLGRNFVPLDVENGNVMIVNRSFVHHVFADRNPIGQRVRITGGEVSALAGDEWYEVIGVVDDFGWQLDAPHEQSAMYLPTPLGTGRAGSVAVRTLDPQSFGPRLRTIAAEIDPAIRVTDVQPLANIGGGEAEMNWALTSVAWLVAFIVLLLSATGIHALMSFTVARRTREIGIRAALGARPRGIVLGVFSRAMLQIGAGLLLGSGLAALVGMTSGTGLLLLIAANVVMLLVGLAACAVPLRRALSIEPTEALRAEA